MSTLSMIAVILLSLQSAPAPKEHPLQKDDQKTTTFLEYRNTAEGITFKMENGRVELTVPAAKGKSGHEDTTTYKAGSVDEFKRLYPDIAKKYDVDQYLPKAMKPNAIVKWWEEWANQVGRDEGARFRQYFRDLPKDTPDVFGKLDRWFDDEHQILRDLERRMHDEGAPAAAESPKIHTVLFGVLIAPVDEALRSQLCLKPHEGLLVADVEKGSIADAAGVKKQDVLLKLSGQPVDDPGRFREQMMTALQSKEFILEVIRGGSPMKLTVHPAHS